MGRKLYPSNPKAPPPKQEPPMTTTDIAGLCEGFDELLISLRSETDSHPRGGRRLVNPDGPEAADTLELLVAEVERMREALEFYADEDNWFGVYMTGCGPMADDWSIDGHPYWPDGKPGKTARAALKGEDQ